MENSELEVALDDKQQSSENPLLEKLNKEEFGYLANTGFTSEIFKIELKNLPKFYGFGEIKKLINNKLKLSCNKIKIPSKNSSYGFLCFRNDEDRQSALKALEGYTWKGNVLKATYANPAQDPLVRKRKQEEDGNLKDNNKKPRTVEEASEPLGSLPYEEQLTIKQNKIEEILKKFKTELAKANNFQRRGASEINDEPICEIRPIIGSPAITGYRNKCEFTIGVDLNGDAMVGNRLSSYASGCTSVASIDELKMPTEKMKLATKLVCEFVKKSQYEPFKTETYEGTFRNLTIRQTRLNDGFMVIIGIHPQKMTRAEKEKFQKDFVKFFTEEGKELNVTSIYYEEIEKRQSGQLGNFMKHIYGDTHIKENLLGLEFRISASSFFQGNSSAAEELYQVAIDLADVKKDTTLMDICCGTGTIGLCFAKKCKRVFGMEIVPEAILDAKANAEENGITNAEFEAGNADDLIYSMLKKANIEIDDDVVAIVDPPRAGLHVKSIMQLRNSKMIRKLVYISCSPAQVMKNFVDLSKNSSKMMKGPPFVLKVAQAVDMFPHTPHCELVVMFERAVEKVTKVVDGEAEAEDSVEVKATDDFNKEESE